MREKRMIMYKKGVFRCQPCNCNFVHENWIEMWRIRCPKCGKPPTEDVAAEDHMEEETIRY